MFWPRLIYEHILGISAALADFLAFIELQKLLTYEIVIYLKLNDIFVAHFDVLKKYIYDTFEKVFFW